MAELLNYRASHSAVYYKPVKLILPGRFVAGLSAACVLTIIVAMAYAVVLPELRSFLLRIGASLTFSAVVGVIGGMAVRYGKLRIPVAAGFVGLLLSLLAFYCSWLFWVHHIVSQLRFQLSLQFLILNPISFFRLARLIEMSGAWTYNHNAVSGVPLLICWVFESAFLLAGGVLLPVKMMLNDDPSCVCGAQCRRVPRLPRFATDRQDEFVASIENREYSAMETHLPPAHEDHPEISLRLMSCPRCGKTHVLTVNRIEWRRTANRTFLQTTPLINQMMISDEATQEIRSLCEKIKLGRAAKLKIT